MVVIHYSSSFASKHKKYIKNNPSRKDAVKKSLRLFIDHPEHPSLHLEKLSGSDIWSIRVTKGDRIFLLWLDNNNVLLLTIGSHDEYRTIL